MKGMRSISPLGVRIPDDVKEKIQERAKNNGRSMNAEIVQMLEDTINGNDGAKDTQKFENMITELRVILHLKDELLFQKERTINALLGQVEVLKGIIKDATGVDFDKIVEQQKSNSDAESKDPGAK